MPVCRLEKVPADFAGDPLKGLLKDKGISWLLPTNDLLAEIDAAAKVMSDRMYQISTSCNKVLVMEPIVMQAAKVAASSRVASNATVTSSLSWRLRGAKHVNAFAKEFGEIPQARISLFDGSDFSKSLRQRIEEYTPGVTPHLIQWELTRRAANIQMRSLAAFRKIAAAEISEFDIDVSGHDLLEASRLTANMGVSIFTAKPQR